MINTYLATITPEVAAELLKYNTNNRPLKQQHIKRLVGIMKRGEWRVNGDSIRISKTKKLLDSQHRLQAVIDSGITIQSVIVEGLDDEVFSTIDRGSGRTMADVLSVKGEPNYTTLAGAARIMWVWEGTGDPGLSGGSNTPTVDQLLATIQKHPGLRDSTSKMHLFRGICRLLSKSQTCFLHYIFTQDSLIAESFFERFNDGMNLTEDSPILHLRNRLIEEKTATQSRLSRQYILGLVFKAYKLHKHGKKVKQLKVFINGDRDEQNIFQL
jgi:hypothetical protein